ncbi:hypothetical protein Tco_0285582 [Tanacetum coccineum]
MSDSDESRITYTAVSSPFGGLSDIGSPRADDHDYLELPWITEDPYVEVVLQAPPSPNYVPGLEEPEQAPPSPDYVPDLEHANDEIFDPEADLEEDDDEDPEEDPVDYLADGGDDGDDKDEPSEADEEDDMDIEADEEEEHPAPADYVVVALPAADQASISIPAPVPIPAWSDSKVARLLAISTPPASPLSLWSSPLSHIPFPPLPPIPSPALPLSPPLPILAPPYPSPIRSLGYRATMIRMRAEAASTSYSVPLPPPFILSPARSDVPSLVIPPPLPISVLTSSPPLLLPSASRESSSATAARPAGGLRTDYVFIATMDREIRRNLERDVGYGITDSSFETRVRQDMDEIYTRLDIEQSQRQLLAARLISTERGDSTTGTGDHIARTGDSPTRIGNSITGTSYRTTGTAGTRWRSYIARTARGGW